MHQGHLEQNCSLSRCLKKPSKRFCLDKAAFTLSQVVQIQTRERSHNYGLEFAYEGFALLKVGLNVDREELEGVPIVGHILGKRFLNLAEDVIAH